MIKSKNHIKRLSLLLAGCITLYACSKDGERNNDCDSGTSSRLEFTVDSAELCSGILVDGQVSNGNVTLTAGSPDTTKVIAIVYYDLNSEGTYSITAGSLEAAGLYIDGTIEPFFTSANSSYPGWSSVTFFDEADSLMSGEFDFMANDGLGQSHHLSGSFENIAIGGD